MKTVSEDRMNICNQTTKEKEVDTTTKILPRTQQQYKVIIATTAILSRTIIKTEEKKTKFRYDKRTTKW